MKTSKPGPGLYRFYVGLFYLGISAAALGIMFCLESGVTAKSGAWLGIGLGIALSARLSMISEERRHGGDKQ